jgi:hypothetical protein
MVVTGPREDEESGDENAALVTNRRANNYTTMDSVEVQEEPSVSPQGNAADSDALEYGASIDDAALLSQFHEDAIKQVKLSPTRQYFI